MAAHTRSVLRVSCAEAVADAVVLVHVARGHAHASVMAARLGATVADVTNLDSGAVQVTTNTGCGVATSTAVLG